MNLGRPQDRAPRPPARLILTTPVHFLAFGCGSGLSPWAPGTFGTVLGLPLVWLLWGLEAQSALIVLALLFLFGCWLCGESSRLLGVHDSPGIVFDEVVGLAVACLPLLPAFGGVPLPVPAALLLGFALFRLFDIAKPWPIRWLDLRVHGGFGIMVDDLLAGVYAAGLLALLGRLPA